MTNILLSYRYVVRNTKTQGVCLHNVTQKQDSSNWVKHRIATTIFSQFSLSISMNIQISRSVRHTLESIYYDVTKVGNIHSKGGK